MAEFIYLNGKPLRGDEKLTPGEACAVLDVSNRTLRRLVDDGLPCWTTPNGHRRYLASDVLAIRAARRRRS